MSDMVSSRRRTARIERVLATSAEAARMGGMTAPGSESSGALPAVSRPRLFARALARHCPVCGQGQLFRRWFQMVDRCPRCGLHFERERGQWTGHLGLNTIVSFGALLLTLLGFALLTWPDLPAGPAIVTALAVAALVPLLFYPWSKTIWLAFDLAINPLRADEAHPRSS